MTEEIQFLKRKGRYDKYATNIWGNPFYIIVEKDEEGNIKQMFEKPNFKKIGAGIVLLSGMHLVMGHPEENHIDWYFNDEKVEMEKTEIIPYWLNKEIWVKNQTN